MKKPLIINCYGGPGTGKSTTAAGVFSMLKSDGINCEYVQEYAKDKAWEFGTNFKTTPKVFQAQEYIFAQQHFRIRRCREDVDMIVTDSPLLLGLVYMPLDFELPSLQNIIREAYHNYNNLDIFLKRQKPFNTSGRMQNEQQSLELDVKIKNMLIAENVEFMSIDASTATTVPDIVQAAHVKFAAMN